MKGRREPKSRAQKRKRHPLICSTRRGRRGNGNNRSLKQKIAKAQQAPESEADTT